VPKTTTTDPHDPRMQATAEKLHAALIRLTGRSAEDPAAPTRRLTVAALAREARVGRNAIYANHRDILDDLARARQRQRMPDRDAIMQDKAPEQRAVINDMQCQLRQLATVNAGLMRRAIEAERRADRAERRSAQLTKELDLHRRPTVLRAPKGVSTSDS
jgi:hypothetical protein